MSLTQPFVPNDSLLYDAASGAELSLVKTFFNQIHLGLNSNMRADGGSIEEGEAAMTLGTMSFGIRYEHPRENYANVDRLVVTAEKGPERQMRANVDFTPQQGDTKLSATIRWLNEGRALCLSYITTLGLPFKDVFPPALGVNNNPINAQPETNG